MTTVINKPILLFQHSLVFVYPMDFEKLKHLYLVTSSFLDHGVLVFFPPLFMYFPMVYKNKGFGDMKFFLYISGL